MSGPNVNGQQGVPAPVQVPMPPGMNQSPPPMTVIQQGPGAGYGVENLPPVPQQQQSGQQIQNAQVQPQPSQPAPVQISGQTVLDGPDVPVELRGKTMAEVLGLYRGLARLHVGPSQVAQPAPVPQAQHQARPQVQQTQPQQQPAHQAMTASEFFRDPGQAIRNAVREVVAAEVQPALAPVQHQALMNSIAAARVHAANQIGVEQFQQLEPVMQELLQGADPQALANPQMWMVAAQTAAGRMALAQRIGQEQPQQPQQPPRPNGATPAGGFPAQFVGPHGQPLPNVSSFFSEQPGTGGAPVGAAAQLNASQMEAARLMDMTPEQYLAWSGGVQRGNGR